MFYEWVWDVYVEEHGKIGNESKSTFFVGRTVEYIAEVQRVDITVQMKTKDSDGLDWGGPHRHSRDIKPLPGGRSDFMEEQSQGSPPVPSEGQYELHYTIVKS